MWLARNKNGVIWLFSERPVRYNKDGIWVSRIISRDNGFNTLSYHTKIGEMNKKQFLGLSWEDEPIEIELVPKMMNAVQEKLSESVDNYFDYVCHVQDIHPYSKEQEQNYYNDMCWRWQDWNDIKYDHPSTWDLNFDDYVDNKR